MMWLVKIVVSTVNFIHLTVNYTGEYDLVIGGLPGLWNGPPAVLYRSFDTLTGLGLMAGSSVSKYDPLVPGKVNRCVRSEKGKSMCSIRETEINVFNQGKVNQCV